MSEREKKGKGGRPEGDCDSDQGRLWRAWIRSPGSLGLGKAQEFYMGNMTSFWPTDFWPSSSPDVNPLDFAVWSFLEGKTTKPHTQ
ncbi:Uncharacterized protein FKW44_020310, partial [Caligus rogercresseyi]